MNGMPHCFTSFFGRCLIFGHCSLLGTVLAIASVATVFNANANAADLDPMDWPNWRGPQQNRVSTEKELVESWDPDGGAGSNLLWMRKDLGGRSSPVVFQDRLYTIVRDKPATEDEGEKVVCVDAATGKTLWEHRFNMYLTDVPDERIGWSCPAVDPETGNVYVQGVCGYFCCLDGKTGKVIWDRSLHEEFGLISTYGGRTNVPVVFEDSLLISAVFVGWGDTPQWGGLARPAHRFMCFDKKTGELRWLNGTGISPYDTTYSTPTVAVIDGQAALVFASGDGEVWALQPRTGKPLWHYPMSGAGMNVSPLVTPDGRVYVSHSEENKVGNTMGAVVALDGRKSGDLKGSEIWQELQVMAGKSSPVILYDRVYFVDDRGKLYIYDAKTGEFIARKALGTSMRSTPLVADGKLYICTNEGRWYILKPNEDGVEVVHQLRLPGESESNDGSPAVSHGRIFLPTSRALYCLANADQKPAADPLPPAPQETHAASASGPAQLQVVPYDVLLSPGEEQSFHVRLFDVRGQEVMAKLAADALKFSVNGPGNITSDGTYTAPSDAGQACALVTCKLGDFTATARVRITPPLPWKFDFNDGDVPLTWIGGRVRFQPRELNGEHFIAKLNVLPTPKPENRKLGTRSFVWMGPIDLSSYTIQADVSLKKEGQSLGDVGLINSRYQLTIRGMNRKLRLDTWTTSDYRTHTDVDFEPVPDTWYTMKLCVTPGDDEAKVQGKIWRRGEAEPKDWTVEMVDHSPNLHGTPGLYGKSSDAEIYVDNLIVTPN